MYYVHSDLQIVWGDWQNQTEQVSKVPSLATYFFPSAGLRRAVVITGESICRKYCLTA